ncbi:MAG: septum formation initiator family protein [Desulfocapsaceae bacterium]|nr:septum formation initiator family protein [Desulfocapsaceae bacterium]
MKKKPKKPLTPLQQNRLLKIILGLVAASMLWIFFAPGTGIYSLLKLRNQAVELEAQTTELTAANKVLRQEIDRLKNDSAYLEQIAREKYGMLKKNERVFDFSKPGKTDDND